MQVRLPQELQKFVSDLVASGRYASADEAVVAALQLLQDEEFIRAGRLEAMRQLVQEGIESIDTEGALDGDEVFADLRRRIAKRRKSAAKPARKTRRRAG